MVFRYFNQTLQDGFPKKVEQEFPGVPCHLDAAVECPKGECSADSVLFFKGKRLGQICPLLGRDGSTPPARSLDQEYRGVYKYFVCLYLSSLFMSIYRKNN